MQGNATTSPPPMPVGVRSSPGCSAGRRRLARFILLSRGTFPRPAQGRRSFGQRSVGRQGPGPQAETGKIVKFGNRPALLVRVRRNEWKAFSAVCTHLNCTVQFSDATQQIWCACHNGVYDLNGKVVSGPPPAPLEEYAVKVRGDEVVISRRA